MKNEATYQAIRQHLSAVCRLVSGVLKTLDCNNPEEREEYEFFEAIGGLIETEYPDVVND